MNRDFAGEVAELYHTYRHGYPDAVIDLIAETLHLTADDIVVDLGCGTGQLTLPLARRVRAVIGLDPEPDMLRRGHQAASDQGVPNVNWMLGADHDVPGLRALLGPQPVAALTVGQALHWMRSERVFAAAPLLLRPGGGVAVVTNGTPLWLQDTGWSRGLREFLQRWLGEKLTYACGTDAQSQQRYHDELDRAGFEVLTKAVDYVADLTLDQLIGGVYSAFPPHRLPAPGQRPAFAEQVRQAVGPGARFPEHVHVAILIGKKG